MVTVSGLPGPGAERRGLVVVLDDISEVIRAQQALAWREVARRIAHEIKNPLTPIQLSTQRLRKKFAEGAPDVASVFDECTRTIIQEVEGLRNLVDEFSRYARMPAPRPRPGDLHQVIQQVAQLYAGIRPGIALRTELDPAVPPLNLDPDQMKRALINLVDNAVAALGDGRGRDRHLHAVPVRGRPSSARDRRHRPRFSPGGPRPGLLAVLLHEAVLGRFGPGDRQPDHRRARRGDPDRG